MKLHEKIYWCRKRVGLSQEALAEKLRQSRAAESQKVLEKNAAVEAKFNS